MKVAFITRVNLYKIAGGDTVQVEQTAKQLRNLGVQVDILSASDRIPYQNYDLLHFFGIPRPGDMIYHSRKAKMPFVVSTIHASYNEFFKRNKKGLGLFFSLLGPDSMEYFKTIVRWLVGKDRRPSAYYLLKGQHKSIVAVLETAGAILPNSESELNRLKTNYTTNVKSVVVTNGINPDKFPYDPTFKKDDKLIVCVARIENGKNQLNLIKALNNTSYQLVLIGPPSANQMGYYKLCVEAAAPNVTFFGKATLEQILPYLQKAKVHVLPSWFETTGLSSLEAAIMGCNLVITDKGDTRDYFGDDVFYCEPDDPDSIRKAIEEASAAPFNEKLYHRIINEHTWKKAAEQTLRAYNMVIKKD